MNIYIYTLIFPEYYARSVGYCKNVADSFPPLISHVVVCGVISCLYV